MPEPTQRLILLAAAEPLGDAALLWRAADRLSLEPGALAPATEAGLLEIDDGVRFQPPAGALGGVSSRVTSRTTSRPRRAGGVGRSRARCRQPRVAQRARGCRAGRSPWRRSWNAAQDARKTAAGLAAAAAFLDRATALTPDPTLQAGRALAAAEASFQAGEFEATQRLLATAQSGALDGFQQARAALLRRSRCRRVALRQRGGDAAPRQLRNGSNRSTSASLAGPT